MQPADTVASPVNGAITRSRSRYRSSRPTKPYGGPSSSVAHRSTKEPQPPASTNDTEIRLEKMEACGQTQYRTGKLDADVDDREPQTQENPNLEAIIKPQTGVEEKKTRFKQYVHPGLPDDLTKGTPRRHSRHSQDIHFASKPVRHGRKFTNGSKPLSPHNLVYPRGDYKEVGNAASAFPLVPLDDGLNRTSEQHSRPHKISTRANKTKRSISPPVSAAIAAKPAFDAPISSINTGERSVRVKFDGNDILVPFTPSTTVVDIIKTMSSRLSISTSTETFVLLESFRKVGIERPLRRYERIRNVLNSVRSSRASTALSILSQNTSQEPMFRDMFDDS